MSVLGKKSFLSFNIFGDKKGISEECSVVLDNLFLSYANVEAFLQYKMEGWGLFGGTMLSSQISQTWYKLLRRRKSPLCQILSKYFVRTNRVCPNPEKKRVIVDVVLLWGTTRIFPGNLFLRVRCRMNRTKWTCPMIRGVFLVVLSVRCRTIRVCPFTC
jgi:hypothetical protein